MLRRALGKAAVVSVAVASAMASLSAPAALGAWSLQTTANQPGVANNVLEGVACPRGICIAVGYYGNGSSGAGKVLAEHWDGSSWSIFKTVVSPASDAWLAGVSCTAPWSCMAVGAQAHGNYTVALTERWNGHRWSVRRAPQPKGALGSALNGVACTSGRDCVAVGYAVTSPHGKALVERWNGRRWSIEATLKAPYGGSGSLDAVACPSRRYCVAGGTDSIIGPDEVPLAARGKGGKWSLLKPHGAPGARASSFSAISCSSPHACTAVGGTVQGTYGPDAGFAERWNGHKWSLQSVANPNPGPLNPSLPPPNFVLNGLSCPSANRCLAVGQRSHYPGPDETLVEQWDGHTWSIAASPNPAGGTSNALAGIACTLTQQCTAVGSSTQGDTVSTLAEGGP